MPFKTSGTPSAAKLVTAPRSAVSKTKRPAVKHRSSSRKNVKSPVSTHSPKKARRHSGAFTTLKSRQQAVERAKVQIWRHLQEINGAVIKLAESGSYLAARTLFDFAGVYSLPPLEDGPSGTFPPPATSDVAVPPLPDKPAQPVNKIEAFLQTLGLDPLSDEEPDVAAVSALEKPRCLA